MSTSEAVAVASLTTEEREELELYRNWMPRIAQLCEAAGRGDLEVRALGNTNHPVIRDIVNGLNRTLDVTDAFVRESAAALQAARDGRFHRRIIQRGLPGSFSRAASVINATADSMKKQAIELEAQREREQRAADELRRHVEELCEVVSAAAQGDLTRQLTLESSGAVGLMADSLRTFLADFRRSMGDISANAVKLTASAERLSGVSRQMAGAVDQTSERANNVSAASQQVTSTVQSVAAGTEEMSVSIREIARNAAEGARVASSAVSLASHANTIIGKLGDSSKEVGDVARLVASIAQQTKLLALNATIEAARAGEAGKGFAVVANEVKELAKETAKATETISHRIEAIQSDTRGAIQAIGEISSTIDKINAFQTTIASAVEEQTATTAEMGRNITECASGTNDISRSIGDVAALAVETAGSAKDSLESASELSEMATTLRNLVARYRM